MLNLGSAFFFFIITTPLGYYFCHCQNYMGLNSRRGGVLSRRILVIFFIKFKLIIKSTFRIHASDA